jgi:hypothetical protein
MNIAYFLDLARQRNGFSSDLILGKAMGVTDASISFWRNQKVVPKNYRAVQLAFFAGVNPVQVIAVCEAARERDPKKKAFWTGMATGAR